MKENKIIKKILSKKFCVAQNAKSGSFIVFSVYKNANFAFFRLCVTHTEEIRLAVIVEVSKKKRRISVMFPSHLFYLCKILTSVLKILTENYIYYSRV